MAKTLIAYFSHAGQNYSHGSIRDLCKRECWHHQRRKRNRSCRIFQNENGHQAERRHPDVREQHQQKPSDDFRHRHNIPEAEQCSVKQGRQSGHGQRDQRTRDQHRDRAPEKRHRTASAGCQLMIDRLVNEIGTADHADRQAGGDRRKPTSGSAA